MGKGFRYFLKEDIQMCNRHMIRFNTTKQQVNAYQNHNKTLPHTYENDYYQKDKI